MARKVSGGIAGSPGVGALQIAPTAVVTAATNQNITFSPDGTASVVFTNNAILNAQNDLRFADSDSSNWVAFQAPATIASNVTWTLPATDGTSDQVLTTNASGTLSWTSKSVVISDQTVSSSTHYPLFTTSTSGAATGVNVSTTKLTYQPSTGTMSLVGGTASSSTTTGTLVVTGGVGISGNLNVGVEVSAPVIVGVSGYVLQLAGTTLSDIDRQYIVANTASITLTLPLTSTNGRTIVFVDGNNFGSFNVTIGRNTRTIGGLAEDLVLNLQGSRVELVYYNTDWKLFIL
jgi:hypothetical protein